MNLNYKYLLKIIMIVYFLDFFSSTNKLIKRKSVLHFLSFNNKIRKFYTFFIIKHLYFKKKFVMFTNFLKMLT